MLSQERNSARVHNWEGKEVEGFHRCVQCYTAEMPIRPSYTRMHICIDCSICVPPPNMQTMHNKPRAIVPHPLKRFPASLLIVACLDDWIGCEDGCLDGCVSIL